MNEVCNLCGGLLYGKSLIFHQNTMGCKMGYIFRLESELRKARSMNPHKDIPGGYESGDQPTGDETED